MDPVRCARLGTRVKLDLTLEFSKPTFEGSWAQMGLFMDPAWNSFSEGSLLEVAGEGEIEIRFRRVRGMRWPEGPLRVRGPLKFPERPWGPGFPFSRLPLWGVWGVDSFLGGCNRRIPWGVAFGAPQFG